jgi:hypothetical protein
MLSSLFLCPYRFSTNPRGFCALFYFVIALFWFSDVGEDAPFPFDRGFVLLMLLQYSPGTSINTIITSLIIYNITIIATPPGVLC